MSIRGSLLLLLLPVCGMSQDSSIVKWSAIKKGKDPTEISLVITADIKKGYYIHPCESCSVNDWTDKGTPTYINISADSNWKVNQVFNKNKAKQWTRFDKETYGSKREVKKNDSTYFEPYTATRYTVDCRVYDGMKVYRGIELVPSEGAIARYNLSLDTLYKNADDKKRKELEKKQKDAIKTLLKILPPPDTITLTITYKVSIRDEVTVLQVPNTYKTKKKWGWKKTPRKVVNNPD